MGKNTLIISITLLVLFIPVMAFASQEIPAEESCTFTSHIDRSIRQFSERVQIFGFVHPNCEVENLWDEYSVHIQIVNAHTGELVEAEWDYKKTTAKSSKPTLYEWKAVIQETGVRLVGDKQNNLNHKVWPNHYYTELPMQLNEVHFEPYVVYSVVATYGDMTVINNFLILNSTTDITE